MTSRFVASILWAWGLGYLALAAGCRQLPSELGRHRDQPLPTATQAAIDQPLADGDKKSATLEQKIAAAQSLARQDDPDQRTAAIEAFERIVSRHRVPARVYHQLAVLYDKNDQLDKSTRYYLAALQQEPNHAQLLSDYGYSLYLRGDLVTAERTLRRAVAADPDSARAYANLGLVLARSGKDDEGLAAFARAGCSPTQARENLALARIPIGDGTAEGKPRRVANSAGVAAD